MRSATVAHRDVSLPGDGLELPARTPGPNPSQGRIEATSNFGASCPRSGPVKNTKPTLTSSVFILSPRYLAQLSPLLRGKLLANAQQHSPVGFFQFRPSLGHAIDLRGDL